MYKSKIKLQISVIQMKLKRGEMVKFKDVSNWLCYGNDKQMHS
jgi:hypothetical protein